MIEKIKELCVKYREIIVYIIVGLITTICSWIACFLVKFVLDTDVTWQNTLVQIIGWCAGIAVAYPLNRSWVFRSKSPEILKELLEFMSSRVATGIMEIVIMDVTVNALHMDYWIAKIFICTVIVTVLNYVFSKLWVFKNKEKD